MKSLFTFLMAALCGMAVNDLSATDTVHVRGWLGGDYALARSPGIFSRSDTVPGFPAELRKKQHAGVFVHWVPTNSPAARGGLQAGDVILRLDEQKLEKMGTFYKLVARLQPGQRIQLSIWREGKQKTLDLVAGRETYRKVGTFGLGFHFFNRIDLWPNPNFSLLVVSFNRKQERQDLSSPESEYLRRVSPDPEAEPGKLSQDGWRATLVIASLGVHNQVLAQELVKPPPAP